METINVALNTRVHKNIERRARSRASISNTKQVKHIKEQYEMKSQKSIWFRSIDPALFFLSQCGKKAEKVTKHKTTMYKPILGP